MRFIGNLRQAVGSSVELSLENGTQLTGVLIRAGWSAVQLHLQGPAGGYDLPEETVWVRSAAIVAYRVL